MTFIPDVSLALSTRMQRLDATAESLILQTPAVRRLTPLECERLMGFPDGWTALSGMSDSVRYRMLGNAVVPHVAEWIGGRVPVEVRR